MLWKRYMEDFLKFKCRVSVSFDSAMFFIKDVFHEALRIEDMMMRVVELHYKIIDHPGDLAKLCFGLEQLGRLKPPLVFPKVVEVKDLAVVIVDKLFDDFSYCVTSHDHEMVADWQAFFLEQVRIMLTVKMFLSFAAKIVYFTFDTFGLSLAL